jgi:hypothetical protein
MLGRFGKTLPLSSNARGRTFVVEADPRLGEVVRLTLHSRLLDGEVLGNGDADATQKPENGALVVLDQVLVDHFGWLGAAAVEESLPSGVMLVDAQLEVVYRREAEAQPLPNDVLVGVPTPLPGLERLPQETAWRVVSRRWIQTSRLRFGKTAPGTPQGRRSCSPRLRRARRTKSRK